MPARSLRIVLIAAAALGVLAFAVYRFGAGSGRPAMVGVVVAAGHAAIEATDQVGPSGRLVVRRVVAPGDSWVVAYAVGAGGEPVGPVGLTHVGAGVARDVVVRLSGEMSLDQEFVLVLHADRGVPGRFEFDATRFQVSPDKPYYVAGAEVRAVLHKDVRVTGVGSSEQAGTVRGVTVAAGAVALEVAPRLTVIDRIVVDRVLAPAVSWVAVYLVGDDGAPTERIGLVRVRAGESSGLEVPVDVRKPLTEKLLVVLHADRSPESTFDFEMARPDAGADLPYVTGGAEVSAEVVVRAYGMGADNMAGEGSGGMSGGR